MLIDCIGIVLFGIQFIVFIERKRSHSEREREKTTNEQKKKTHVCATASVLMSIILWWMCGRIWWSYRCWVWGASTFFHTNRCSCPNIVGKSASWMPHNRHPINHYLIINENRFFFVLIYTFRQLSVFIYLTWAFVRKSIPLNLIFVHIFM